MKLQNLAVIFCIIIIPIVLIFSYFLQVQIDTITLQNSYNTKLYDATYDAIVAFNINSIRNNYTTIADSKKRDIEAAINVFFSGISTNLGFKGYKQEEMKNYIPAILFTSYDGYYIHSSYRETASNGTVTNKYGLKPYIYYSEKVTENIVINYSLDNYVVVYIKNGVNYTTKAGYYIDVTKTNSSGTSFNGVPITNGDAQKYFSESFEFTNWLKTFNITKLNDIFLGDPDDEASTFNQHRQQIIKESIQSNLNQAIAEFNEYSSSSYNFKMPIFAENEWNEILNNVSISVFMQGLQIGNKVYNNYSVLKSTNNKLMVNEENLFFIDNNNTYHKIDHEGVAFIQGEAGIYFKEETKSKDATGNAIYDYTNRQLACYDCIVNSNYKSDWNLTDFDTARNYLDLIKLLSPAKKQLYYETLARYKYKLYKPNNFTGLPDGDTQYRYYT